jgi:hypothetical protein
VGCCSHLIPLMAFNPLQAYFVEVSLFLLFLSDFPEAVLSWVSDAECGYLLFWAGAVSCQRGRGNPYASHYMS